MSLSLRIAPHLPYLRRFARAVTGSQTSGDAYVSAVLEALIADVDLFPEASNDRIALYKIFIALFDRLNVEIDHQEDSFGWEKRAASNLAHIAPAPRQAFLLEAVEGFSANEAAEVMGIDDAEFTALIDEATRDISDQMRTEILIIEDEPLIAMDIEQLVEGLGHSVTGIARTRDEALDLFHKSPPKMVLADIQLADGSSGIDAVKDMLADVALPVIFITAFPERLLTGERPEPAFLVTKPFNPDMLKALISQALFFETQAKQLA